MSHLELNFSEYRPDVGMVTGRVRYTARLPLSAAKKPRGAGRPRVAVDTAPSADLPRIPCEGYLEITLVGEGGDREPVAAIVYGGVPTVKSAEIESGRASAGITGPMITRGGAAIGFVRTGKKGCPGGDIEDDFEGFAACPAETWIQIGKAADPFVAQVKLRKVAPVDTERSFALGTYFIYQPARVVVTLPA